MIPEINKGKNYGPRTRPAGPPAAARSRLLGLPPRRGHAPLNWHTSFRIHGQTKRIAINRGDAVDLLWQDDTMQFKSFIRF